ncbi:hypothetical protein MAQ5080_02798 [Marinomonas aquimarina]|uniref:Uncharacterized protein n=1 Tax=Marinomonas aquimarina TaxID=295068 RepID=A0A1A8TKT8_9GAMM|nr:hypothetical protein [Marinomonas aquimarina]SBS34183.1 hypothetical protein MAQ5080_02798 [Marinomonas aquimarina]
MKRVLGAFALVALVPLVGCASKTVTPSLSMGDSVVLDGIEDQRGHVFDHQTSMQALLFVDGMSAKDLARESLESIDTACMEQGKLVYLADISGMPSLISDLIAIPKMRRYPYPIWLDREGDVSDSLPVREDQVTVLKVNNQVIESVSFAANAAMLTEYIADVCPAASAT